MMDLSVLRQGVLEATIEKYKGIVEGKLEPTWDVDECPICRQFYCSDESGWEEVSACGECPLIEDGWCREGDKYNSKLCDAYNLNYMIDINKFLKLLEEEKERRNKYV